MVRRIAKLAVLGGFGAALVAALGVGRAWWGSGADPSDPWRSIKTHRAHTDHTGLINGTFEAGDGRAVTRVCLTCHADAAEHFMATSHWTWEGQLVHVPGHENPQRIGKKNLINNFCIAIEPNLTECTTCHAGYGWVDSTFDFGNASNVDCLVCHDQTGTYQKADGGGFPNSSVDLLRVAQSVGSPTRQNCGYCHFAGGGGDAVKHGDMDGTMYFPSQRVDAHMGKLNLQCIDCHATKEHNIAGRSMSVSVDNANRVACTDCHAASPHNDERLDGHSQAVACQTCHIPVMAVDSPTKMTWDWSTAGEDRPDADPHEYLKIKGSFTYERKVVPEYAWYNGSAERYLAGDVIDPRRVTQINYPMGSVRDPEAKIWPFKVHKANQPYDTQHNHLLIPKTAGPGGYWTEFNWQQAFELGAKESGVAFSGHYDFAKTEMWWPLSHMVSTKDKALQCTDCHGESGRMDWTTLGYRGDPSLLGGRLRTLRMEGAQ